MKYEIQVGASALEAACFLPSSPLPHSPLRQAIIRRCFISCLLRVTCFCHDFFNPMTRMARFVNPAPLGTSTVRHVTKVCRGHIESEKRLKYCSLSVTYTFIPN